MKPFQLNPERGNLTKFPGVASSCCSIEHSRSETSICYNFFDWNMTGFIDLMHDIFSPSGCNGG